MPAARRTHADTRPCGVPAARVPSRPSDRPALLCSRISIFKCILFAASASDSSACHPDPDQRSCAGCLAWDADDGPIESDHCAIIITSGSMRGLAAHIHRTAAGQRCSPWVPLFEQRVGQRASACDFHIVFAFALELRINAFLCVPRFLLWCCRLSRMCRSATESLSEEIKLQACLLVSDK